MSGENVLVISRVLNAEDTATRDIGVEAVLTAIRTGGKKLRGQITQIRNRFESELDITGDLKAAKLAVEKLKKDLPGVTWSGRFSYRASDKLLQHSGLFCRRLGFVRRRNCRRLVRNSKQARIYSRCLSHQLATV